MTTHRVGLAGEPVMTAHRRAKGLSTAPAGDKRST
jgi:hypothetical protein